MPYIINRTDGSIVATITDGTVDRVSTSLTLIGKNYKGIGEFYNENLVHLLENFSNSTPPENRITGQMWYNTTTNKMNVFDGNNWRPVGSPFVTNANPGNFVAGDLWIDTSSQQLKFYDGNNLITAGPIYTNNQGKTGWIVEEILDRSGNSKILAVMYVAGTKVAIFNTTSFVPLLAIDGFTTGTNPLKAGFSFSSLVADNNINAPAQSAISLIDPVDGNLTTDKFIRSDKSGSINGSLTISSINGIVVGPNSNLSAYIDVTGGAGNEKTVIANYASNTKMILQVKTTNTFQNSITLNPVNKSVVFFDGDTWQSTLLNIPQVNINANTTIQGNLVVNGATTFTNSTTLQISDKNIELAVTNTPTDTTADGAGITVLGSTGNNKTIIWNLNGVIALPNNISAWTFSDNIKIPASNSYYIGNSLLANSTTLGSTIINSSLTSVGDLIELTVDKININDNKITVDSGFDLEISVDSGQIISLENQVRITNVSDPLFANDVSNKNYVDSVKTSVNYLTIDITSLVNPNVSAVAQIDALIPAISVNLEDVVRVLCLSYANGVSAPTVTRILKIFKCQAVVGIRTWVHQTGQDQLIL
jgi:hypothetical protein